MAADGHIRYVKGAAIDRARWDACIDAAPNGVIYAYSFYLDRMAGSWDGLVLDDYAAVLPLPWRKKWGIGYVYQPFLTAQLGVFGKGLDSALVARFLGNIPFRLVEYPLNAGNLPAPEGFGIYARSNYILNLSSKYEELARAYREQTRRNIRKSEKYGGVVKKDIPLPEILRLSHQYTSPIGEEEARNFTDLYHFLQARGAAVTYGVISARGDLLASAAFVFSHNRAYYLLVGNHPNGRTLGASHALIDAFIQDHAERPLVLDFEGSDLRSLAFFYSSFGAQPEPYPAMRLNRLPWWAKLIKS